MLTQERLKQVLRYDPATGNFMWLINLRARSIPGNIAGSKRKGGPTHITIDTKRYKAHRLAWLYMTGGWPVGHIDHANGSNSDNRWQNLREATMSQNIANAKRRTDNSSGFKGVSWDSRAKRWVAYINKNQRKRHIGTFHSPEEAHAAYVRAAKALFGEFARAA